MGVVYDEVYITTRREIHLCEKAIERLKRKVAALEKKHAMTTADFAARFAAGELGKCGDFVLWHEAQVGIEGWGKRLRELEETLVNPPV
jgi:hypothetical protein